MTIPSTMRAERLDTATHEVSVQDVPVPEPGPGEVLIEVAFCGICHSDLSLIDGTFPARVARRGAGPRGIRPLDTHEGDSIRILVQP